MKALPDAVARYLAIRRALGFKLPHLHAWLPDLLSRGVTL